jgi:hypothetical protein
MSLDTRANHAVRSLQESVVRATPPALPTVTRRHRASLVAGLIGALAIAFGSIALAAMLPDSSGDDAATDTSLISDPEIPNGELVALPENGGEALEGIHQENSTSTALEPYTKFYGAADPGTVVLAYSPYGSADLVVGESGEFSLKLFFEGAPTGASFPVTLTVGDQEYDFEFTWLWDPQNIEITAFQGYGQSEAPLPFEKFYGSAPPGTIVTITSAYGSADTVAGDNGEWFRKVWFEGQPMGEPFPITVTVGDQAFEFSFLWLFDGTIEVSVHQEGTTSDSASPYTRFVGTGPAGTTLIATSAYGSADHVVGESGEFSFKLWFSNPPAGVKFPITFKVDGETFGTYYFTWYEPGPVGLTVNQYNTESDSPEPYVKFYGTAEPGTTIALYSSYGASDMTVGESGEWLLKLWFSPLPPAGETIPVDVKVNGSFYGRYYFTSYFDGENVAVTVNQYNTESEAADPWVKFYGTAPVGTEIRVISPYGSWLWNTEVTSWNSGHLFFEPLPPAGQTFTITVKVNGETWGTYPYTSWYEATAISVNHTYFTSDLAEPYDDLWGTAPAGSLIKIISEYGTSEFTVGAGGTWEKRQFFTGAPYNTQFPVTVKVNGVVELQYYFTVLPPA